VQLVLNGIVRPIVRRVADFEAIASETEAMADRRAPGVPS
jgi:hypothetical protein